MPGPLSPESLTRVRRSTRKFGYHPNMNDVENLLATIDKRDALLKDLLDRFIESGMAEEEDAELLDELHTLLGES